LKKLNPISPKGDHSRSASSVTIEETTWSTPASGKKLVSAVPSCVPGRLAIAMVMSAVVLGPMGMKSMSATEAQVSNTLSAATSNAPIEKELVSSAA
jgi:hypothetical protein